MITTMTFDQIADLAATSDGPGRVLDGLVFHRMEAKPGEEWFEYDADGVEDVLMRFDPEDRAAMDVPPRYSTSLDVLKATLAPGMRLVHLGRDAEGPEHLFMPTRPWRCEIEVAVDGVPVSYVETGATMELAFLAASMRLHAVLAGESTL